MLCEGTSIWTLRVLLRELYFPQPCIYAGLVQESERPQNRSHTEHGNQIEIHGHDAKMADIILT